ncbi:hypothetical protein JTE90_021120 [Oedothorax gibbosus]|uniref:ADP-ribosylation factor-like protein 2-binding protein n=1 Tax=Oedothorax gibbosus TaxID=931172 RepID=A0AAV6TUV1_9ARAC|nr:hypothetical protein JTE90_021120 [Oedothorax gibbosus]
MADDEAARRREIRQKKILESSEARLKRITSSCSKKIQDYSVCHGDNTGITEISKDRSTEKDDSLSAECSIKRRGENCSLYSGSNYLNESSSSNNQGAKPKLTENDYNRVNSSNGDRSLPDSYTFPKKVSDAETRSFGRTRTDARRNSTCTQIVMETLQFSALISLTNLRFWLVAMTAFTVKLYFLTLESLPIFQTVFFPFLMLELFIFSWSRLEPQVFSRPVSSTIISSVLLLCGLSSNVYTIFKKVMGDTEDLVCKSDDNCQFDTIIGYIEDIIIDPNFSSLQHNFMEQHYLKFEKCEENKLEYMEIFNTYTELIEKHIEESLIKRIPGFSMKEFLRDILNKQSELDGDVFDMLVSFTDFLSFKEMFLDYKAAKSGFTPDLSITCSKNS